jgi:hypothetical protein
MDIIFVVTDVEADGLRPGSHSMISIASIAITEATGEEVGRFTANLRALPEMVSEPATMMWWAQNKDAWEISTRDARDPAEVIADYVVWVRALPAPAVFVGQPACFDGDWINWYLMRFAGIHLYHGPRPGRPLFEGGGVDLVSLIMGATGRRYSDCGRPSWPQAWYGGHEHSHCALDDALGYAAVLRTMLEVSRQQT